MSADAASGGRRRPPQTGRFARWTSLVALAAAWACSASDAPAAGAIAPRPQILIQDVVRFFEVYDAAGGRPTEDQLQHDYIDSGSEGLHQFAKVRNLSGDTLATALALRPADYSGARRCVAALDNVRRRLTVALGKLGELYPAAKYPPVTIFIGPDNTGGTTRAAGVLVGLETICRANWLEPNIEDRLVHLIAHEYAHVQQPVAQGDSTGATVLLASEIEGGAEFIAELTSGSVSNTELAVWTKGRTRRIETAFVADEYSTDKSNWLFNGPGTPQKPGDLGYWVGYRIVKSYYLHATDKRAALRDIIQVQDAKAFLAKSGWFPGIILP
jgi:Predicted Zn-dependent protease (DUF2268)